MDTTGSTSIKDIGQYLHLYLGCDVMHEDGTTATMVSVDLDNAGFEHHESGMYGECYKHKLNGKLILRPLSDMTEEEARECWKQFKSSSYRFTGFDGPSRSIFYKNGNGNPGSEVLNKPEQFRYLISKGFDLFGLIESGLAIGQNNTQMKLHDETPDENYENPFETKTSPLTGAIVAALVGGGIVVLLICLTAFSVHFSVHVANFIVKFFK